MTSIWFPNNKYPPNTKNYLPCFVLGGGFSIRRKGLYIYIIKMIYSPAAPPASTKKLRQRKNPGTELEPKHWAAQIG